MTRGRTTLSTRDLALFFGRAWQLRFAATVLAIASLSVVTAASAADSFQLSPQQRANAALGNADARIQIPGSAPVGSDGRDNDRQLRAAVAAAGGLNPSIDYLASGLQTDGGDETAYILEEIQSPATNLARMSLQSGNWPTKVGETVVSAAVEDAWPVGSSVHFFNNALQLKVVGVYADRFNTKSREFVVPVGTWSSLRSLDATTATRLDETANRVVRWSGTEHDSAVLAAVNSVIKHHILNQQQRADASDLAVESRAAIESVSPAINVPLALLMVVGPIVAGLMGGILTGGLTTRIRTVMWTIGIPYQQTRAAAILAALTAGTIGAAIGTAAGIGLGFAIRPLLLTIATQELGPVTSSAASLLTIPLGVLGVGAGLLVTRRQRVRPPHQPREASLDRMLYRLAGSAVLIAAGVFVGTGASDIAKISLAALVIAAAVVIAVAPVATLAIQRLSPSSFASRLAFRKFAAEGGPATLTVISIAILQILGCSLAILLTSTIAQVNASTESQVPPGQVVFQPGLVAQQDLDRVRAQFEQAVGVSQPIIEYTAGAGSERQDGATRVIATTDDLQEIIRVPLSPALVSLLERGGTIVTKPLNGAVTVSFPPDGEFPGATFPAAVLQGLDPSFRNIDGFMLEATAKKAGLPLLAPSYIYSDVTSEQENSAQATAQSLSINPDWVQVYRAPDELTAPLRVSAITILVSLIASIVLLLTSMSQARSLRPDLSGLRAIGVGPAFLRRVVLVRMGLTFVLATSLALATSAIGVAAAFSLARLNLGLTVPAVPVVLMVVSLGVFTVLSAAIATRRLRTTEWS